MDMEEKLLVRILDREGDG